MHYKLWEKRNFTGANPFAKQERTLPRITDHHPPAYFLLEMQIHFFVPAFTSIGHVCETQHTCFFLSLKKEYLTQYNWAFCVISKSNSIWALGHRKKLQEVTLTHNIITFSWSSCTFWPFDMNTHRERRCVFMGTGGLGLVMYQTPK